MDNKNKNIINGSLRLIKQCPVCATKYEARKIQIIDFTENGVLVHFFCDVCQSSLLAQITEMPFGIVGSAMLTDLVAEEVNKFRNSGPVTIDDVIEVHQKLM
ncbi:MAG TPA: hypothetical protein PKZ16_01030 [bacterium]|nr:hypothetical protein [bacterium]HPL95466.1 hypothetical protein [bacterium]